MMTLTSYYHIGNKLTLYQVITQPLVPISFLISMIGLGLYFFLSIKMGIAKNEKQISWLLTLASSVVCTIVSLPYYYRFYSSGWDMQLLGMESTIHTCLVCFFMTYLILDLTLGSIYYKSRITIATGWIHHSIYIVILFWLMRCKSTSFFTVNAILELPTVILALGSMKASWRCDVLFACSFFALRLVYHAFMILAVKQYHRIESLWLVATLVFPLHIYWFYGIVQLQVKRIRAHFKSKSISSINSNKNNAKNAMIMNLPSPPISPTLCGKINHKKSSSISDQDSDSDILDEQHHHHHLKRSSSPLSSSSSTYRPFTAKSLVASSRKSITIRLELNKNQSY
ncbi:unnamed protein product [Cunninghamella echinulata]